MLRSVALLLSGVSLIGCAALTGLDGSTSFGCKVPDGVRCESVSTVHRKVTGGHMPGTARDAGQDIDLEQPALRYAAASDAAAGVPAAGRQEALLLRPERVLRVWLAPFEDQDGDLHEARYVYLRVGRGEWVRRLDGAGSRASVAAAAKQQ